MRPRPFVRMEATVHGARVHRSLIRCSSARDERRPGLCGSARLTDGRRRKQATGHEPVVVARLARARSLRRHPRHPRILPAERPDFPKYRLPGRAGFSAGGHFRRPWPIPLRERASATRASTSPGISRAHPAPRIAKGVNCYPRGSRRKIGPLPTHPESPHDPLMVTDTHAQWSRRRLNIRGPSSPKAPECGRSRDAHARERRNLCWKRGPRRVYGMKNYANSIS